MASPPPPPPDGLPPPDGALPDGEDGVTEIVGATNNIPVAAIMTFRVFTFTFDPTGTYVLNFSSKTLICSSKALRTS